MPQTSINWSTIYTKANLINQYAAPASYSADPLAPCVNYVHFTCISPIFGRLESFVCLELDCI